MIRKFKALIVPTVAARSLAALVFECDKSGWPESWGGLREGARDAVHALRDETDALLAWVSRVDAGRGVAALFADERDEALTSAGIVTVAIDMDLSSTVADDEHGPDALRAFVALCAAVATSSVYGLSLRMGAREANYREVLDELQRQARERGVLLELPEDPREGDRRRRPKASSDPWTGRERIDPREVFGDVEPDAGVFDEDLDEDERGFLDEAGIAWPAAMRVLEEAWRAVAFSAHPDRRPDDAMASRRFVRLKSGYERLRARAL